MADPEAPAPRRVQTVVLRAGPPKPRRLRYDIAAGIAGGALILLAIALAFLLPEEDVLLPQFQVDVEQVPVDLFSERLQMSEGETVEVAFEVPVDNAFFILVRVGYSDDVPSSRPDTFEVAVFDPTGRLVGDRATVVNDPGILNEQSGGLEWTAVHREARISFDLSLPPEPTFVTGDAPTTTEEDVAQAFTEQHHVPSAGTWTVRVTLREAGDCPEPSPELDPRQLLACQTAVGDAGDTGNPFSIELFQYTYFEPRVSRI